ncbi:MAG: 2-oxo acid dehydrogenase subunit E2 [Deltaproteobacteria bacterium]|nr:2-oxo acid dehydrogenase subunit E2 [Deltaproteobacteria bacterium]
MSRFEFKLPDVGEGVTEGEVVKWLVKVGDAVGEDEPMVEVMTDKATVTITSPKKGRVLELGGAEGSVIAVHSMLVILDVGDGAATPPAAAKKSEGPAATAVGDIKESLPGMDLMATSAPAPKASPAATSTDYFEPKPLATPATRKLARDRGIDLRTVRPTGPSGRVAREDVLRAAGAPHAAPTSLHEAVASAAPRSVASPPPAPGLRSPMSVAAPTVEQSALEVRTPLKGVRKKVFEGMARSKHTAAHFTFVEECDVSALKALRERLRPLAAEEGVKLTFLPFFVKAVVAALKKHPSLNSAFDEATNEIVERRYYNLGIASSTEQGLMVPVVKDADKKSLLGIARDIQRLGDATKSGKVAPEDLRGSTFTITSLGTQGGLFATPILNLPEVGILGLHQIKQKPVVRDGQIVIGEVMLLSLSFDHRLIDGHVGAAFAYEIIHFIENPDKLWLES